jgi:hypothetical protein
MRDVVDVLSTPIGARTCFVSCRMRSGTYRRRVRHHSDRNTVGSLLLGRQQRTMFGKDASQSRRVFVIRLESELNGTLTAHLVRAIA